MSSSTPTDPSRVAFSYKGFRFFWLTTLLVSFAVQIMSVSIAWQIYDVTGNVFLLGLVGLSLFLPALLLILVTGLTADRFNRRGIMAVCLGVELLCALGFLALVNAEAHEVWPIFGILIVLGTARAFWGPAAQSLAPNLVPPEALSNAITVNASAWQFASIMGPAAGGLLYGLSPTIAFGTGAVLLLVAMVCVLLIPRPARRESQQATSLEVIFGGFRYIFSNKVVLGAISLDMFAVLMGGAVALLPVYVKDILHAGPEELGLLRAAPGIGAIVMALYLTRFPIRDHAGKVLFLFVGLFGAFTVVFGLSTTVWISIPALALVGAADMVSVTIRETIMQLWTPEEVRGRVNAVNSVFIGASNELGEFRAGTVAHFIGPVAAVAMGGFGAIAIAVIWSRVFPGLREQRTLDKKMA
ncbi:MFS transporter [Devosia sp. J2-20]|jgi:MFS family permease|uniref:MFS transporter n=1 Tax=Devosia TaxID=46913 RepID=UPI0022AF2E89|nr:MULTISPECIES: MFS transporter [Devosia]MCZ4345922.1 MFS transporter [Devosia neptuniae]WDQ98951.1 MFS transporter [Devosia sp. J2-20]|tara:strand:- start:4170 stop:5408 length:1239 start_codon:yes stop_codon:yes gene_type:complete